MLVGVWVDLEVYCKYVVDGYLFFLKVYLFGVFRLSKLILIIDGGDFLGCCVICCMMLFMVDDVVRMVIGDELFSIELECLLVMLFCGIESGMVMWLVCNVLRKVMMYLSFCGVEIIMWLFVEL